MIHKTLPPNLLERLNYSPIPSLLSGDEWVSIQIKDGPCSHDCSYCYARREPVGEISVMQMESVIGWFLELGIHKCLLIGSEPTEHSAFQEILDMFSRKRFTCGVYTNGDNLSQLLHPAVRQVILHLSHTPTSKNLYSANELLDSGKKIDLRVNFDSPDLTEMNIIRPFLAGIHQTHLSEILLKYSVTSPVPSIGVQGFDIGKLKTLKPRLISVLTALHNEFPKVLFYAERPLFKCVFSESELEDLYFANIMFTCFMEFTVYRDMTMNLCSPGRFVFKGKPIESATDISDSIDQVRSHMETLARIPSFPECRVCEFHEDLSCFGGCIGNKESPERTD